MEAADSAHSRRLNPVGVLVDMEAEHTCMRVRGINDPCSSTRTRIAMGAFKDDADLRNQSADYYYGVRPSEATAARPGYRSGAALNWQVGARIGYGITDAVMFTGMVSVRFLDGDIQRSPIVGRSRPVSTIC